MSQHEGNGRIQERDESRRSIRRRSGGRRVTRPAGTDSSVALLTEGYLYGRNRFERAGGDLFETRLMLRPATVVYGADAARMFYDGDRFGRERAMPTSVMHLLQDEGSVQSLTGAAHRRRKSLFVELLMDDAAIADVQSVYRNEWARAVRTWTGEVVLHDELVRLLTRVALRWVGIAPSNVDVDRLSGDLIAMINGAGSFGPANWAARARRRNAERWARDVIAADRRESERLRLSGRKSSPADVRQTPLRRLANARGDDDRPLPLEVAAVELLNVLRPTVAVARFIVFGAHAMNRWPGWRRRLRTGATPEQDALLLTHEVRRCYPFFPVIGGTATRSFEWRDRVFEPGDWVLLDLYATNHDERIWGDSTVFRPDRFRDWDGDPFTLVPQGAGDAASGHRCPGERATVAIMETAMLELARLDYYLPEQDLSIALNRFPALPHSGFLIGLLPPARARGRAPSPLG
ncbi:cytochrome P450 [Labedella populi]|uniref:Cytochrome P450 n=1 Tax=Labedella populi TaxID=2498850 RepID=A0A3S4AZ21_9MICO|nr:cytochrome P450 [Labedella populi]RWZ59168.1 cytochrome P450 [Labedella populi]